MKKPIELKLKVLKGGFETIQIGFAATRKKSNEHVLMLPDKYNEYEEGETINVIISELDERDRKIEELKEKIGNLLVENDKLHDTLRKYDEY